jgi:hypothetical protein
LLKILIFLLLVSCLPRKGKITFPEFQGAATSASISSISISGSQMVINGTNLENYNQVSIWDPSAGIFKPFQVTSATAPQIISESINSLSLPMDKALELILSSASAQQTFPITFTLQPNSVDTDNLVDGSIIGDKIRLRAIPLSKLSALGSNPNIGDYIRWNGFDFVLDPGPTGGGGGGASGTVTAITTGPGLLSSSNPITTIGTISVDIGTAGPTIKIPYFNNKNKIVMDSSGLAPDFSGLRFKDGNNYFDIFNENAFKIENNSGAEILILDYSGALSVSGAITSAGSPVCTAAAPCGAPPGSVVTSVTASPPLIAAGNTDVNISAPTGIAQGDLVLLGAPGSYPGVGKLPAVDGASLLGVITDVLPGNAITVSKFLGDATVGVRFGSGNAQQWQRNLDNLGTLNPNDNYVIIGNGTSFEVQGGDTLLTSIGAGNMVGPATSIPNTLAQFSDSTGKNLKGTAWTVPNNIGSVNQFLSVVGGQDLAWTSFPSGLVYVGGAPVVADNLPKFGGSAGTQITDSGIAAVNVPTMSASSVGADYVILSGGANKTLKSTAYTIPPTIGSFGQVLISDGVGALSWITPVPPSTVNNQTGTTYTLASSDCGNTVTLNNAAAITVSMPNLSNGCRIDLIQLGAGIISVVGIPTMVLRNSFNVFNSRTQYSVLTVNQITSTLSVISGDVN